MNSDQLCGLETDVVRATRTSHWDERLRGHVASCPSCRETVRILTALNTMALDSGEVPPTPDPQRIWLKAAFAQRQETSALVSRVAVIAYGILAAIFGVGAFWFIKSSASNIIGPAAASAAPGLTMGSATPLVILLFLALALFLSFSPTQRRTTR